MGDGLDICPRRRLGRWLMAAQTPTYVYEWRWRLRCPLFDGFVVDPGWGAVHESELYFVFPQYRVSARDLEHVHRFRVRPILTRRFTTWTRPLLPCDVAGL